MNEFDVLIVGAGLSGIGAACRLQRERPDTTYASLEARDAIGGTWDLFRYPGVRADTDAFTLGYAFRPWAGAKAIADGADILAYIRDTATEHDIARHIRFGTQARTASWSSETARWTVTVERAGVAEELTCRFLHLCTGYYDYTSGYDAQLPGTAYFTGQLIHPQFWPEDLECTGKRVVVIGSGATAVTLVPALVSGGAAHVTMLQRSPSYVLALPAVDAIASILQRVLPDKIAHQVVRGKNMALLQGLWALSRHRPELAKRLIRKVAQRHLPDSAYLDAHFTPTYQPWDQRLCLVPDGDLFRAIRSGAASVVTDHIDTFVADGIRLRSGELLEADIVVTATGLSLLCLGGVELSVDGEAVDPGTRFAYRAMMLSGVPNLAFCFGYANNSWTLRADLSSQYLCRLLAHMERHGHDIATPTLPEGIGRRPFLDLTSGYVLRAAALFPAAGDRGPWTTSHNHLTNMAAMRRADLTADMTFRSRVRSALRS